MLLRAGHWRSPPKRFGPNKMNAELEASWRKLYPDGDTFEENRKLNTPERTRKYFRETKSYVLGTGLTKRQNHKVVRVSKDEMKWIKEERKWFARDPFGSLRPELSYLFSEALWHSNCYYLGFDSWIITSGNDAPFEGLRWYADEMMRAYHNALTHCEAGDGEGAAWHAFRAGTLQSELGIRLAHNAQFEKYEAVHNAQRDHAKARKTISDHARQEAYWHYRNAGHKRVESGRLAGEQLGLSEASIRNAFPGGKYPPE